MAGMRKTGDVRCRHHSVEIIGGPFDGHQESVPHDPQRLPEDVAWPVSESIYRLLEGRSHGPERPITSFALYERQKRKGRWCYCFLGTVLPTHWLVEHLVVENELTAHTRT